MTADSDLGIWWCAAHYDVAYEDTDTCNGVVYGHWRGEERECVRRELAVVGPTGCDCPPCPGRGNDGHGMTHCAECCFGTLVIADPDCPLHGEKAYQ